MAESYYVRPSPSGPEIERLSASFAKLFRTAETESRLGLYSGNRNQHAHEGSVITQQPSVLNHHAFGSQISNTSSLFGGIPLTFMCPPPPMSPPQHLQNMTNHQHHHSHGHNLSQLPPHIQHSSIGIPLPGLEVLDRVPFIKVTNSGILSGSFNCAPRHKMFNLEGDLLLKSKTQKLFCPFDSRMKSVAITDINDECVFQLKFTPSICECDSEEKRCFAVFSPLYENPFGAILFEAGQLKYSLKILNALEGETYAVQFVESEISIKGADGTIVAVISIQKKRGVSQKYTLTFTEEISSANKALFIACIITLELVSCEASCTKCICFSPIFVACVTIVGLSLAPHLEYSPPSNPKP